MRKLLLIGIFSFLMVRQARADPKIFFVDSSTVATTGSSASLPFTSKMKAGMLLISFLWYPGLFTNAISEPSGFTQLASYNIGGLGFVDSCYKVATGNETNIVWTFGGATITYDGLAAFSNTRSFVGSEQISHNAYSVSVSSMVTPPMTTTKQYEKVIDMYMANFAGLDNYSGPVGSTQEYAVGGGVGAAGFLHAYDRDVFPQATVVGSTETYTTAVLAGQAIRFEIYAKPDDALKGVEFL